MLSVTLCSTLKGVTTVDNLIEMLVLFFLSIDTVKWTNRQNQGI
jgi:hypothetical protein